jgi:hypothetical protein
MNNPNEEIVFYEGEFTIQQGDKRLILFGLLKFTWLPELIINWLLVEKLAINLTKKNIAGRISILLNRLCIDLNIPVTLTHLTGTPSITDGVQGLISRNIFCMNS